MTSLDRAFIKAFSESGASLPAGEHRLDKPSKPSRAIASVAALDSSPTGVHVAKETLTAATQRARSGSTTSVAPLSTFTMHPQHESHRALLEVEHLSWPEACDELLTRARADWERFAELLARQIDQGMRCIALTSCHRGEGRTNLALATAKLLTARGLGCVVVDADFEHPHLADTCGISAQSGWGEVLSSAISLGEALVKSADDGLTLMPWCGPNSHAAERTNTLPMATTFGTLRDHYDLVLLDTMPLNTPTAIAEFTTLAKAISLDAVYMIFDARSTSSELLSSTCATLRRSGLPVEGLIENFGAAASFDEAAPIRPAPNVSIARQARPLDNRLR
jgi:Mrp family chromosome partitioning ATPase